MTLKWSMLLESIPSYYAYVRIITFTNNLHIISNEPALHHVSPVTNLSLAISSRRVFIESSNFSFFIDRGWQNIASERTIRIVMVLLAIYSSSFIDSNGPFETQAACEHFSYNKIQLGGKAFSLYYWLVGRNFQAGTSHAWCRNGIIIPRSYQEVWLMIIILVFLLNDPS